LGYHFLEKSGELPPAFAAGRLSFPLLEPA
jgi:hypothetical protein